MTVRVFCEVFWVDIFVRYCEIDHDGIYNCINVHHKVVKCSYIPTHCYRWSYLEVRNHFYTPAALTPRKEPRYPLGRSRSGLFVEDKKKIRFPNQELNHVSSVAVPGPSRYADFATILELGNNSDKDRRNKSRN
jgi:hypothetical protein